MARPKESISTKKGKEKLREHSEHVVRGVIRNFDKLQSMAEEPAEEEVKCPHCKKKFKKKTVNYNGIKDAFFAGMEIMPFLRPKLQAVALAELNKDNKLDAIQLRNIAKEVAQIIEVGRTQFINGTVNSPALLLDSGERLEKPKEDNERSQSDNPGGSQPGNQDNSIQ